MAASEKPFVQGKSTFPARLHVLKIFSKIFTKSDRYKSTIDQELLALVSTIAFCSRHYDISALPNVVLVTDNKALAYLANAKDLQMDQYRPRVQRLLARLRSYRYKCAIHIKSEKNVIPDVLSRSLLDTPNAKLDLGELLFEGEDDNDMQHFQTLAAIQQYVENDPGVVSQQQQVTESEVIQTNGLINLDTIRSEQGKDKHCSAFIKALTNSELPRERNLERHVLKNSHAYQVTEGILYKWTLWMASHVLVIPRSLIHSVIQGTHVSLAHSATLPCLKSIRSHFFWNNMAKDVQKQLRACTVCLKVNKSTYHRTYKQESWKPTPVIGERIFIDFFFPKQASKHYKQVLLLVDAATHYCVLVPCNNMTSQTVLSALLSRWISVFSYPKVLVHDSQTSLGSTVLKEVAGILSIKLVEVPRRQQQMNLAETFVRLAKQKLDCLAQDFPNADSAQLVTAVQLGLNCAWKKGFNTSSYQLMFKTVPNLALSKLFPQEIKALSQEEHAQTVQQSLSHNIVVMQEVYEGYKNYLESQQQQLTKRDREKFKVNDLVLAYNGTHFVGPFVVQEVVREDHYRLSDSRTNRTLPHLVHIAELKPYVTQIVPNDEELPASGDLPAIFEPADILTELAFRQKLAGLRNVRISTEVSADTAVPASRPPGRPPKPQAAQTARGAAPPATATPSYNLRRPAPNPLPPTLRPQPQHLRSGPRRHHNESQRQHLQ